MFTRLHDSHRIDHLFTGTYGSLADDLDVLAHISICCIYHATVHSTGFYPGEYRADIGAVVCLCLYRIQNFQRVENLLGVLTYRHTARLSQTDHADFICCHIFERGNVLITVFRNDQNYLIFQQLHNRIRIHQSLIVQSCHLFGRCGEKQVCRSAFLDLCL